MYVMPLTLNDAMHSVPSVTLVSPFVSYVVFDVFAMRSSAKILSRAIVGFVGPLVKVSQRFLTRRFYLFLRHRFPVLLAWCASGLLR